MKRRRKRQERAPAPLSPSASLFPSYFQRAPGTATALCACVVSALALYWISLHSPLLFDDRLLSENFLKLYGTSWFHFDLRWFSYATFGWTYDLVGTQWLWHRLVNLLLHAMTATLLFSFLVRLFEAVPLNPPDDGKPRARWVALFGALLFLLHPVAVYGVAYLAQRPILLATLFGVLSLHLFLEGLVRQSRGWQIAAVVAYFAAVYSKEHAVMLPAVAAALAILVRGYSGRLLRELAVPFTLFACIAALVVLKSRGLLGAPYEPAAQDLLAQMREFPASPERPDAYLSSAVNQGFLFFRYLLTWIVPNPAWMSVDIRVPFPSQPLAMPYLAGFVAWLAFPLLALNQLRKGGARGLAAFGLLYAWLLALPEVAVVRVQEPFVLYRSYLWMSGLPCALPLLLSRLSAKWAYGVLCAACLALVPVSLGRIDSFSSGIKLWDDVVRKNSGVAAPLVERGYQGRGFAYLQAGRYLEAQKDFERSMILNPRDPNAYLGRGIVFARTGSYDPALVDFGRAIAIDPAYAEAYNKRCFTKMLMDRPDDALPDCEKAVSLNPRHRDAFTNLGVVYGALNRPVEAEASYRRALDIEPANADANFIYGVLLSVLYRRDEALRHLGIACDAEIAEACKLRAALLQRR